MLWRLGWPLQHVRLQYFGRLATLHPFERGRSLPDNHWLVHPVLDLLLLFEDSLPLVFGGQQFEIDVLVQLSLHFFVVTKL